MTLNTFAVPLKEVPADRQHRCRLYKIGEPDEFHPNGRWTEVWDVLDVPFGENEGDELPNGELVREEIAASMADVRNKIDLLRKELGIVVAGSWRERGIA